MTEHPHPAGAAYLTELMILLTAYVGQPAPSAAITRVRRAAPDLAG